MNSTDIKKALASRHTKDFYMTEVKTGSTFFSEYQCFDAYAMAKSWKNLKYTGYEIKVSRGDFLQDEKWRGYLPYCNEFYWVCPKDLIKKEEIADDVGLIYVYPETHILRTIKKAQFREIKPPVDILIYLLMWRVEDGSKFPFYSNKRDYFKAWLKNKADDYCLGSEVGKAFDEKLRKAKEIDSENKNLKEKLTDYENIKQICIKHKIFGYGLRNDYASELEQRLKVTLPPEIVQKIQEINNASERILARIEGGQ